MKGPPPQWNRRDCSFDHLVVAAMARGYGKVLVYSGIEEFSRADDIRRGIYRCAKHRGLTADAGPGGRTVSGEDMGIQKAGRTFEVRYRLWTKNQGRRRHIEKYGPDRSRWPYDPRRRATPEERDSWANRDELGTAVRHN